MAGSHFGEVKLPIGGLFPFVSPRFLVALLWLLACAAALWRGVIGEQPSAGVTYAADELVTPLQKATGVRLPVTKEAAVTAPAVHCIVLGNTKVVRQLVVTVTELRPGNLCPAHGMVTSPLEVQPSRNISGPNFSPRELTRRQAVERSGTPGKLTKGMTAPEGAAEKV